MSATESMTPEQVSNIAREVFSSHPDYEASNPLEGEDLAAMTRFANACCATMQAELERRMHPDSVYGLAELISHAACIADCIKVDLHQGEYVQAQLHSLANEVATSIGRVDELYPPEEK